MTTPDPIGRGKRREAATVPDITMSAPLPGGAAVRQAPTPSRRPDGHPVRPGDLRALRARVPASHRDLVESPPVAALTTVMPDGSPQTSVVWCDFDGRHLRVNTMRGFQKERNMRRNPRVTILCYDPHEPLRYLEVRGLVVGMTEDGATRHLDELASKYVGRRVRYFGDCIASRFGETEIPVLCLMEPMHVVPVDAIADGTAK